MKISNSKIVDYQNNYVNARDFWDWQKKTGETLDLILLGFAKPVVQIIRQNNKPTIQINLSTDIGLLENIKEFTNQDYIVKDKYWIPLEMTYFDVINDALSNLKIRVNEDISLGKLFKFISILRDSRISIIESADLANYEIQPAEPIKINLALPLYEYQEKGINWLVELFGQEIGGLLCDEMGLGKTVQAFGLIKHAINLNARKILVATPASLVLNWSREIDKFVPNLPHYLHFGPNRIFHPNELAEQNVVIVSYDLLRNDFNNFKKIDWDLIICDEAQALKNSGSKIRSCIDELNSQRKYLITGTPIENSLTDLWSLIDIVRPGLLGNKRAFQALISDDISDARKLSEFASPLILRRTVKDVAKDLPELVAVEEALVGTPAFTSFYEEVRQEAIQNNSNILATITKLSQICCYPRLVDPGYSDSKDSKINRTLEILQKIKQAEQKVIIFTTFTESLDLLRNVITNQLKPNYISVIDSRVSPNQRLGIIKNFESVDGFSVLCIQPKAGGTGLNIVGANHVIHFNRQWNPAIERQATSRAYRRGQTRTVFEYLMHYAGTIEEYIADTLARKSELAEHGNSTPVSEGSEKDIIKALAISPMFANSTNERRNQYE